MGGDILVPKYVDIFVRRSSIDAKERKHSLTVRVSLRDSGAGGVCGGSAQEESWADCQKSREHAVNGADRHREGRKQTLLKAPGPTTFGEHPSISDNTQRKRSNIFTRKISKLISIDDRSFLSYWSQILDLSLLSAENMRCCQQSD